MGAYADAEAAIESRLTTQWATLHPTSKLFFQNEAVNVDLPDPSDDSGAATWLLAEINAGAERHAGYGQPGGNLWRKSGDVLIRIFVPINTKRTAIRQLIDDASSVFRDWFSGDLKFFAVSEASGGSSEEFGNWYERAVIASFTFDLKG